MNEAAQAGEDSSVHHIGGTKIPPTGPKQKAVSGKYSTDNKNDPLASDDDGDDLNDPLKADDDSENKSVMPSHEDQKLAQLITDKMEEMQALDNEVSQINARKAAIIEELEGKGIKRRAFRMAYAYNKADTDQREGLHLSYAICLASIGCSINPDDFALSQQ